jgi:multidrug resistance protein
LNNKKTLIILYSVVFCVATGLSIITPALSLYAREFGATNFMIGGLIAGFGLARVFVNLPAGIFADRYNQKQLMQFGLAIVVISSLIAAFSSSYYMLLLCRIVEGVGSAFYMVSASTLLNSIVPVSKRGRALSYYTSAILFGVIIGPSLGGVIVPIYGKNSPFFFYSLITFVGFIITRYFIDYNIKISTNKHSFSLSYLNNRSLLLVSLSTFAFAFSWTGLELTVIPLFAYDNLQLSPPLLGLAISTAAVSNLVSTLFAGYLTDRFGRKKPIILSLFCTAIVAYCLSLSYSFASLLFLMSLFGLSSGLWGQTQAWTADLSDKKHLGSFLGFNRTMGDLGFVAGPIVLGYLSSSNFVNIISLLPFYFDSLVLVIVAIAIIFAKDPAADLHKVQKTTSKS